ncbi:hypothetical protein [Calothrix sp. NIES-2098]|uniref:hypothetical protein n=1 Tax=Calothrix sp. NIES-2098 TaxID=1954171 RepID=UPI000B617A13|nr:hypothetical protein NIES2098_27950 [Calothrix sp. NIES-2098]
MQHIFQSAKRLISVTLVTLFLITSSLLSFPAPARAAGDIVIMKCESNCGNLPAFTAGVASGALVTLIATGKAATLGGVVATVGQVATTIAAPVVGGAAVSLVAPVALTAAVGYLGYQAWEAYHHSHAQSSG